uniref:Uncharacterized protein n=1 Tax=Arundo donax TaxID=35708 RepID=A0A0A8Y4C4_ARUDO
MSFCIKTIIYASFIYSYTFINKRHLKMLSLVH